MEEVKEFADIKDEIKSKIGDELEIETVIKGLKFKWTWIPTDNEFNDLRYTVIEDPDQDSIKAEFIIVHGLGEH